jgi:hypothetical protein
MPLSTLPFTSLRDDPAEVDVVSRKLLGMPTIVTVWPRSLAAAVEVTDRAPGERSVPMEDVEAELRGAA